MNGFHLVQLLENQAVTGVEYQMSGMLRQRLHVCIAC